MAVSLAESKNNTQDDVAVIDEFRKESALLDALTFEDVVNSAGGGNTLTYGYRRQITQATAGFRELNTDYTPQHVTTQRYTVDLAVLCGATRDCNPVTGTGWLERSRCRCLVGRGRCRPSGTPNRYGLGRWRITSRR